MYSTSNCADTFNQQVILKQTYKQNVCKNKRISQRKNFDCYVACLSMFLNKDYEYIKNTYFNDKDFNKITGLTTLDAEKVLRKENKNYQTITRKFNLDDFKKIKNKKNKPMIITVRSLNYRNGLHVVFWCNGLFDPNTEKNKKNKNVRIYDEDLLKEEFKSEKVSQIIV